MKKIVVIGGAGFIGCHVAAKHLEMGHSVVVVDNLSRKGTTLNLNWLRRHYPELQFQHTDIRVDQQSLNSAVEDADIIYHLAAQVAVTTSVQDPRTDFGINAQGTFNILEAARQYAESAIVIYASTNKVYGGLEDLEFRIEGERYYLPEAPIGIDEARPLDFHSPYGCSKGAGDQYCRDYYRIYGLRTVVMRQSCIYGTRQFGIEDQGWIAHFVISTLFNRRLTIYGDGKQVRDVLWIEDLVRAYQAVIDAIDVTAGQCFNVGGGPENTMSLRELVSLLEREFGHSIEYDFADWRPGDQRVFVSNIQKAQKVSGWTPHTSPEEGVVKLVRWAKENREELERIFK